jgi:hypothetical protein
MTTEPIDKSQLRPDTLIRLKHGSKLYYKARRLVIKILRDTPNAYKLTKNLFCRYKVPGKNIRRTVSITASSACPGKILITSNAATLRIKSKSFRRFLVLGLLNKTTRSVDSLRTIQLISAICDVMLLLYPDRLGAGVVNTRKGKKWV